MTRRTIGDLELTALLAVARLADEAHGLAIRADVSERTQHDYSVGAIYTTLQRLEDKGMLTSWLTDPLPIRGGRSRRQFKLTAGGRAAIRDAQKVATAVWGNLGGHLPPKPA